MLTALIAVVVVGLVATNVILYRELRRLRRGTQRLAVRMRDGARKVRSMDWATAAAFSRVQSLLTEAVASAEPEPTPTRTPRKPTFPN